LRLLAKHGRSIGEIEAAELRMFDVRIMQLSGVVRQFPALLL